MRGGALAGAADSGERYDQIGQIVVKGHSVLVAEVETTVWRIRGDIIDKIGLRDKFYPKKDSRNNDGYLQEEEVKDSINSIENH